MSTLAAYVDKLSRGESFSPAEIDAAFTNLMANANAPADIKRFLNFS